METPIIQEAMEEMLRIKASALDEFPIEFFHHILELTVPLLLHISKELVSSGDLPESFLDGDIVPLPKKGVPINLSIKSTIIGLLGQSSSMSK